MKNSTTYSYKLDNLTHYGRTIIVPKLAKLFQLDVHDAESIDKRYNINTLYRISILLTEFIKIEMQYFSSKLLEQVYPLHTINIQKRRTYQ